MHVDFLKVFEDHISLYMICRFIHLDFRFQITLIIKLNQRSEQLFKYVIICYLSAKVNMTIKI